MQQNEAAVNLAASEWIIEVAYALPDRQTIIAVKALPGITARAAILASGILDIFPEIDLNTARIGVFGHLTQQHAVLENKDRVEIYRPLVADPKEQRRQRAASRAVTKKGGD